MIYPFLLSGEGGCRFQFCPHTVHNSYIIDIALGTYSTIYCRLSYLIAIFVIAEEVERAVAGASIESRARAIGKLRQRVIEQAQSNSPEWNLIQTTEVNEVNLCIKNYIHAFM